MRLPLGLFFGPTSWLLALLAGVFVGKGIAALQEAGTLPLDPFHVPGILALGVYPTLQGLVPQVLMILVIASVFAYTRYVARGAR